MSIARGVVHAQHYTFDKKDKEKKHIVRVSQEKFENGDPNFIDERVAAHKLKEEKSFLSNLFENEDKNED